MTLEDGTRQAVYFDTSFNSAFTLMHEDCLKDSIRVARLAENDQEDIAVLVRLGLANADEIEKRATSALAGYIGGQAMLPPEHSGCRGTGPAG